MKRIYAGVLILCMLCASAAATEKYNSYFDDVHNKGRFYDFAVANGYAYWLHAAEPGLFYLEQPLDLYRMKPGESEPELLLESTEEPGTEDPFLIKGMVCIGKKLLLFVMDEDYGGKHPAIVNLDGSGYTRLPGNIGSIVVCPDRIYNSVDGGIYEIDIETLKPEKIYSYPSEIEQDHPYLTQIEGKNLYFNTDSCDWYRLDLESMELAKIDRIQGDGFALDNRFYISDYNWGGTYCCDLASGERMQISENTYCFQMGDGDYLKAYTKEPLGGVGEEEKKITGFREKGCIFDLSRLKDNLDDTLVGNCQLTDAYLADGKLYCYDWEKNRVDFTPVAQ